MSEIRFMCEHCNTWWGVPPGAGGKLANCPKCGKEIRIPYESTLEIDGASTEMVGLLVGVDFSPSASEFEILLKNGDLNPGLQYVTIELTKQEAGDEKYLSTMFQGAAVQRGWLQGVHTKLTIKEAKVNGKPVVIVYPSAASPAPHPAPVASPPPQQAPVASDTLTIEVEAETLEEARELVKPRMPDGYLWLSERIISDGMPIIKTKRTISAEAETLEDAREQIKSQMPEGFQLLSERVISDGKPKTVEGVADTIDAAFAKAQGGIPSNADSLEKKVLVAPEQKLIVVEAFDEQTAESNARAETGKQFGNSAIVSSIKLTTTGKKGFLGIGKRPDQYEAEILVRQATVAVSYKLKAEISVDIGGDVYKPKASILVTICKQEAVYADFSQRLRTEENKAVAQIAQQLVSAGRDQYSAIGAAIAILDRDPDAKKTIYNFTLDQIATKYQISRDRLSTIVAEGKEKGWKDRAL